MTPDDTPTHDALDRLMWLALASNKPKADHIETRDVATAWRELAELAVYEEWETPPDANGDHGVIEELHVNEGLYVADVTQPVRHDFDGLPYEVEETCWIFGDHDHPNNAEIQVKCSLVAVLSPSVTDDRWLLVYEVTAA